MKRLKRGMKSMPECKLLKIGGHFTAVTFAVSLLGSCSQLPDAVNPVEWYNSSVDFLSAMKKKKSLLPASKRRTRLRRTVTRPSPAPTKNSRRSPLWISSVTTMRRASVAGSSPTRKAAIMRQLLHDKVRPPVDWPLRLRRRYSLRSSNPRKASTRRRMSQQQPARRDAGASSTHWQC